MQENEIRIGNWFEHLPEWSYRNQELKSFLFQWEASDWYALGECTLSLDYIKPIDLSPEILEKCRFVSNPYQDRYEFGDIYAEYCGIRNICWIDGKPHIEYLHQLQNYVYANTNVELTFKP